MSLSVPHLCLHLSVITHLLNVCLYCSTYVQVFVFKKTCLFYLLVYLSLAYFFGFCLLVSLVTISTNLLSSVQLNSSGAIYLLMGYKKKYIWPSNLQLHGLLALVGNIANKLSCSPGIGYGRRLVVWRVWARISATYAGWTFSNSDNKGTHAIPICQSSNQVRYTQCYLPMSQNQQHTYELIWIRPNHSTLVRWLYTLQPIYYRCLFWTQKVAMLTCQSFFLILPLLIWWANTISV